jgi:nucleoside-diphosphate-sugar epimerase
MVSALVLGGCGFIGRHLVLYLVENKLVEKIKIADKNLREISWLTPEQKKVIDTVDYVQADLSTEGYAKFYIFLAIHNLYVAIFF